VFVDQHDKLLSEVHRKICYSPKEWSFWRMLLQEGMTMSLICMGNQNEDAK